MFSEQIKSATVTADGTAFTGAGEFYGVSLDAGICTLYDNTAASGTKIGTFGAPGFALPAGTSYRFGTGIHVDLTTAAGVTVWYMPRGA